MKADHNITKYDSLDKFVEGHLNAVKRFGTPAERLLALPEQPDEPGAMDEVYTRLGRPETPDGYKLELSDGATEADKAFADGFRVVAHKAGLNQAQMGLAIGYLNEVTTKAIADQKAADEQDARDCNAALDSAWGAKAPVYRAEIPKLLGDVADKLKLEGGAAAVVEELNANGLANSGNLLRILAAVTDMRSEPGALPGSSSGAEPSGRVMTPAEAQSTLNARQADAEWAKALRQKNHPRHSDVLAERQRLLGFINPAQKAA